MTFVVAGNYEQSEDGASMDAEEAEWMNAPMGPPETVSPPRDTEAALTRIIHETEARMNAERQRADALQAENERLRDTLRVHFLHYLECEHAGLRDRPHCACASLDLGWHPNVGAAVDAWSDHVMEAART